MTTFDERAYERRMTEAAEAWIAGMDALADDETQPEPVRRIAWWARTRFYAALDGASGV